MLDLQNSDTSPGFFVSFIRKSAAAMAVVGLILGGLVGASSQARVSGLPAPNIQPRLGLVLETPFTVNHNWIVLDVRPGKDRAAAETAPVLHFILDTGANASLISAEAVQEHKLVFGEPFEASKPIRIGGSGDTDAYLVTRRVNATLCLTSSTGVHEDINYTGDGSLIISPIGSVFHDLGVDGIIGDDFMRLMVVEIDYEKRLVRLYDRDKFKAPPTSLFTAMPLMTRKSDGLPYIKSNLTPLGFNATEALLNLDTGADAGVQLFAPFVAKHSWQESLPRTVPYAIAGINGTGEMFAARLRDLWVGETRLDLPQVAFSLSTKGAMANAETDGQIGARILSRFTIILDFTHSMLYLRPNSAASDPFVNNWYFGIRFVLPARPDGGYAINSVDAGSPAALAGMKAGDILYAIDGQNAAGIGDDKLRSLLQDGVEARTLDIKSADSDERRLIKIIGLAY